MMAQGFESNEIKIKIKELYQCFPDLFKHINPSDILFFRIEKKTGLPLTLIPVNQDPWQYIVPYKYVLVVYEDFDILEIDQQFTALAHQLCKIPKGYRIKPVIKNPDVVEFDEEREIREWLVKHKFNIT